MRRGARRRASAAWAGLALFVVLGGTAYAAADVSSARPHGTSASAANRIYWGNNSNQTIAEANLDGTGGGTDLNTAGASINQPTGTALDPATNKLYWTNAGTNTISVANLDGTGAATNLYTAAAPGGATVDVPVGIAIDPATNKIYWANEGDNTISVANLDGSGGGSHLTLTGATDFDPQGVTIDPEHNKIYWANASGGNAISVANLDGTGGAKNLYTTAAPGGASVNQPVGVAIDPAGNKIYWANAGNGTIAEANLDGSGGGSDLSTSGATTLVGPSGVAIDPAANKIYWANKFNNKISEANLDGSGDGGDLSTSGASDSAPDFPALLEAPTGTGAPSISGGTDAGTTLMCSEGTWASDLLGAFLYRAPQGFTFSWTRNGATISGATHSSLDASSGGSYACQVTAQNLAGSATQTSAAQNVSPPPHPSCTLEPKVSHLLVTRAKHHKKPSGAKLELTARCTQTLSAKLTGTLETALKPKHGKKKQKSFRLAAVKSTLSANESVTLTVKLPKAALQALESGATGTATFELVGTGANGSAHAGATFKKLKLKLK